VLQHILGVVANVTYCFVGNSAGFQAAKEFWKSSRFDKIIVRRGWCIFETQCM